MIRQEQIKQEKIEIPLSVIEDVVKGIITEEWQREQDFLWNMIERNLRAKFIEKACEWLYQHLYTVKDKEYPSCHHVESTPSMGEFITQTNFVEQFKKAMQQ